METSNNASSVSEQTKNACAIETMRSMLQAYALDHSVSFEDALFLFAATSTYDTLFDFETGVWREGPDYLRSLFDHALNRTIN